MGRGAKIRILHVGWGFSPWRAGGLMEYAEDLMTFQAEQGHEVGYFCSGRQYPWGRTRLREWSRRKIRHFEIINSPIVHAGDRGTRFPQSDLTEPWSEDFFSEVLRTFQPQLIHFHELAGLPSSLIEISTQVFRIPTIMTLADFFPLCPTLKLFDRSQQNCSLERPGQVCVRCCAKGPSDRRDLIAQTLLYRFKPLIKRLPRKVLGQIIRLPWRSLSEENAQRPLAQLKSPPYDERRLVNLERLKMIDLLIARSRRVEEIYRGYLGEADHLETINPTLRHIAGIRGQQIEVATGEPLRFVTLNGLASVAKGAEVLVEAVEELIGRGKGDCFELYAWGGLSAAFKGRIDNLPNIRFMGPYAVKELGAMLQGMHVGIVPSIWEEVFGYVGLELLAKGLPLIGNCKGGITEYVIDGETGFQNATCSAMELAGIMERFIENPSLVRAFNKKVLARRWYQTYETHVAVVQDAYAQVLSGGRNREHLLTLMREGK